MGERHRHLVGAYLTRETEPELLKWVHSLPKEHVAKAVKTGLLALPGQMRGPGVQPVQAPPGPLAGDAQPVQSNPIEATMVTEERDPEKDLDRLLGR